MGVLHLLLLTSFPAVLADILKLDMESSSVCTMTQPITVGPLDTVILYAEPPLTSAATRDRCTVKFTGQQGRKFKLHVRDLSFGECQIYVKMYDGDMNLNVARFEFGCKSGTGGLYYSYNDKVAISLEKPDAASHYYKFYMKLATNDGPDIGGIPGGENDLETTAIGAGTIAGIAVAAVICVGIAVAVIVYCVIVYRRKQQEKDLAMSMTTLFQSSKGDTYKDGSSVASSRHSTHSTLLTQSDANKVYAYPAFRTQSISDKHAKCDSIDTKSYESENGRVRVKVNEGGPKPKSILVKGGTDDIRAMKKNLARRERDRETEKEELRRRAEQAERHRDELRRMRDIERGRGGLGRSPRNNKPMLNEENIQQSMRSARDKGRSVNKNSLSNHRTRSHSAPRGTSSYHDTDFDAHSDRSERSRRRAGHDVDRERGSDTDRRKHGNVHRSSSTQSRSRTKRSRGHNDDRDIQSDNDECDSRRRRSRHQYDDDYSDDGHDTGHRRRTTRSHSHSSGRR